MKTRNIVATLVLLFGVYGVAGATGMDMPAAAKPSPGFDHLKSLVGSWEGQTPDGKTVKASYQMVSNGTCLMETLDTPDGANMVTMYHMDGSRLMMDHYCAMNNVPHMKGTTSADGKTIDFAFVSAGNLTAPTDMHMHGLKVEFEDADHFTQEWLLRSKGKDQPSVFRFQRAK